MNTNMGTKESNDDDRNDLLDRCKLRWYVGFAAALALLVSGVAVCMTGLPGLAQIDSTYTTQVILIIFFCIVADHGRKMTEVFREWSRVDGGLQRGVTAQGTPCLVGKGMLGEAAAELQAAYPFPVTVPTADSVMARVRGRLRSKLAGLHFIEQKFGQIGFCGTLAGSIMSLQEFAAGLTDLEGGGMERLINGLAGVAAALVSSFAGVVLGALAAKVLLVLSQRILDLLEERISLTIEQELLPKLRIDPRLSDANQLHDEMKAVVKRLDTVIDWQERGTGALSSSTALINKQLESSLELFQRSEAQRGALLSGLNELREALKEALARIGEQSEQLKEWVEQEILRVDMNVIHMQQSSPPQMNGRSKTRSKKHVG